MFVEGKNPEIDAFDNPEEIIFLDRFKIFLMKQCYLQMSLFQYLYS